MSSSEGGVTQRLRFNLLFVKIDAEGNEAVRIANRPLLILASAFGLSVVITALGANQPDWKTLLSGPLALFEKVF